MALGRARTGPRGVRVWRILRAHPRLSICVAVSLATGLLLPHEWRLNTRLLISWNIGTWLYFLLSAWLIVHATNASMRQHARSTDEGKVLILVLTSIAGMASIGAIFAQLVAAKDMSGLLKTLHIALAGATIVSAWFFIHLTFALHYAHEYFDELEADPGVPREMRGGLVFPGRESPDYYDFLYFSYVIGVASQTADVGISSKSMRRVALAHCVLAFFFNSALLALMINIAAGVVGG